MATKRTIKKAETMAAKAAAVTETPVTSVGASKEEAVKAETKKTETTKTTAAKKTTATKKTATRKPAAKTTQTNTDVYVQFLGREIKAKDVVENIKKIWTEEMGNKEADLNDLKVYVKLEENRAYYVFNGDVSGFVEL